MASRKVWLVTLLLFAASLLSSPLALAVDGGFDPAKVQQVSGNAHKSKEQVKKLFGEPTATTPVQKTAEGCTDLWIYVEVLFDGITPVKTQTLYIGFDEQQLSCSAEVLEEEVK